MRRWWGVKRWSRVVPQVRMRRIHGLNPADHHRHLNVHPILALEPLTERGPASEADDRTPDGQEGFMNVGAALVAHPQPAELVQPPQGPFHHPAVHSQPAAVSRPAEPGRARCGACAIPGAAAGSHRPGRRTAAGAGDGDGPVDRAPAARPPPGATTGLRRGDWPRSGWPTEMFRWPR